MLSTKKPSFTAPEASAAAKYRAGKTYSRIRKPTREKDIRDAPVRSNSSRRLERRPQYKLDSPLDRTSPSSPLVTISVGPDRRLFAGHEDILSISPYFAALCCRRNPFQPGAAVPARIVNGSSKRIDLPDEQPEILSCVLEYLYKGDYTPRVIHNADRNQWELEDLGVDSHGQNNTATMYHPAVRGVILRDTAVYCAAEKYRLEPLKRLALRKQGLHTGIQCNTILLSARYAYSHTPDTESKLRAHYLALIIRSRSTFKRSGTMQMEMEKGGNLFFDLFVAMCNHIDDLEDEARAAVTAAAAT